jgi:hypothetical protein
MSEKNELNKLRAGEITVEASQLRPGVHVRLPLQWMEHQFMFNSFVIADEDQARQIAAMNLPQIYCDPGELPGATPAQADCHHPARSGNPGRDCSASRAKSPADG